MKHYFLLILFVLGFSAVQAENPKGMLYKHWMIEDINNGKFANAVDNMLKADWEWDTDYILDMDSTIKYMEYVDTLEFHTPQHCVDSFKLYVANTSILYQVILYQEGDTDKVFALKNLALQIYKEIFSEHHPDYAIRLHNLGTLYYTMGDYTKAEKYHLETLRICKNVLGENHPDYATCLNNLGVLYSDMGNYAKAEDFHLEALRIRKEILGETHPDYATSLSSIGTLYEDIGDYVQAEKYLLESLRIRKEFFGKHHPDYATCLNNLGVLYSDMGNYAKAEDFHLEALRICKEVLGENHLDYASSLNNLGTLYNAMGDYSHAEKYLLEALRIRKEILGESHPEYATSVDNCGKLYESMGDYANAEKDYREALCIRKEKLGENHPYYATSLSQLGNLYRDMGDYTKAEKYLLESLRINKGILGQHHPNYATCLNNLGVLYSDMGNYAEAEKYYLEALRIQKETLGENHLYFICTLGNLSVLYTEVNDQEHSLYYLIRMDSLSQKQVSANCAFMTETQRESYWQTQYSIFSTISAAYYFANLPDYAYNLQLFMKGLLLSSFAEVKRSIMESGDSVLIANFNQLTTLKAYINKLQTDNPQSPYLQESQQRAEQLEKEIMRSSMAYRENMALWNSDWKSVRDVLSEKAAAIEFFDVTTGDTTTYAAILLLPSDTIPRLIRLFTDKDTVSALTEKIWKPILPNLSNVNTIYFSPSGILHQVAMEYLPYDSISTMADKFSMVRLTSTRELLKRHTNGMLKYAALYGGIEYDVSGEDLLTESKKYATEPLLASRGWVDDSLDRGIVRYLPGAKKEVDEINSLLTTQQISTKYFSAKTANEESFKAISGEKQNIIHIATHGFSWSDSTAKKKDYFASHRLITEANMPAQPYINPLNRCGLLFAGANIALSGHKDNLPDGVQDGILTAKEISLMDLRNCNLVVLSACNSGLGDITADGIAGLQRGFKMAGVKSILMSLWAVDDAATYLLMTQFYKNYLGGKTKTQALREAQGYLRTYEQDGERIFDDPKYWAAFVLLDALD